MQARVAYHQDGNLRNPGVHEGNPEVTRNRRPQPYPQCAQHGGSQDKTEAGETENGDFPKGNSGAWIHPAPQHHGKQWLSVNPAREPSHIVFRLNRIVAV